MVDKAQPLATTSEKGGHGEVDCCDSFAIHPVSPHVSGLPGNCPGKSPKLLSELSAPTFRDCLASAQDNLPRLLTRIVSPHVSGLPGSRPGFSADFQQQPHGSRPAQSLPRGPCTCLPCSTAHVSSRFSRNAQHVGNPVASVSRPALLPTSLATLKTSLGLPALPKIMPKAMLVPLPLATVLPSSFHVLSCPLATFANVPQPTLPKDF
ncbi:hypothetical protein ACH5RR_005290 [Cinchona calisaya]|uniref:Uncharacterized protein n=1 Tax=Cinchona calisaya TaxID=153742 RepID=A0ABD3AKZ1_9GENT